MTTDITELAQREKFEAWWERTQHNGNPPRFGWSHWRDGEGYKVDDDDSELEGMWEAWKAAGAEMIEALESEKRICATWRKTATAISEKLEKTQQCITELKSHTVKLPKIRRVKLVSGEYVNGWTAHDVACALSAAGIKWEDK